MLRGYCHSLWSVSVCMDSGWLHIAVSTISKEKTDTKSTVYCSYSKPYITSLRRYFPYKLSLSLMHLQVLVLVVIVAALCDISYTVYQDSTNKHVAHFQYLSPTVLAVTMVCRCIK